MKYLLDTSVWIEYFEGSQIGEKVSKMLKNKEDEFYTIPIIISEVISKIKRKRGDVESAFRIIKINSELLEIRADTAKEAGIIHAREKDKNDNFSLADAIIIKIVQDNNIRLITKDNHFKKFKEAIII